MNFTRVLRACALTSMIALAGPALAQSVAEPVRIGVLTDLSGAYADLSGPGTVAAVQMAVEDLAGELGLKVDVVSDDTQGKPDIGTEVARRWYDTGGVDIILDVPGTPIALAVSELAVQKNKIVIFGASASNDITGARCNANAIQYVHNVASLTTGVANALIKAGKLDWYFITADYAFGAAIEAAVTKAVQDGGGKVLGTTKHPLNNLDFSSAVLSAQASGAQVVVLANGGQDFQAALRQANEFGLVEGGQDILGVAVFISDIHSLGAEATKGLSLMTAFAWNRNDDTRAFAERFYARTKRMPTSVQAGMYSAAAHYLRAVAAAGTKDTATVVAKMRATPVNDFFATNGVIRADGLHSHDMYRVRVKAPADMTSEWDHYTVEETIPGEIAFGNPRDTACPTAAAN